MDQLNNAVTAIEPWKKQNRTVSEVELNKALSLLGFGAWSSLEPSKSGFRIFLLNVKHEDY